MNIWLGAVYACDAYHTLRCVSVCVCVRVHSALSPRALIYFGYLMLGAHLGLIIHARAPHLPPPEIYCRETLRFITTTTGVWNFNTQPPICGAICDCWSSVLIYTHVVGFFIDPLHTSVHLFYFKKGWKTISFSIKLIWKPKIYALLQDSSVFEGNLFIHFVNFYLEILK